jgi:hypothetical protein
MKEILEEAKISKYSIASRRYVLQSKKEELEIEAIQLCSNLQNKKI